MKIVLCGESFPDIQHYLRNALPAANNVEIVVWDGKIEHLPSGIDVLIPMMYRVDADLMDRAKPKLIQQWGSGLEGVDISSARDRGIVVANVAALGGNADSVAEHGVLLILALLRKLNEAQLSVRDGRLGSPVGTPLAGQTVCLYGLGAIALPLAKRLRSFDVRLVGVTRDPTATKVEDYNLDACYSYSDDNVALKDSKVLVVCLRQSAENGGAIGRRQIRALPKGALVVNIARGGLVDYDALLEGLQDGHIGGAGLDVFWKEPASPDDHLLSLPNVIVTPHIAGITTSSMSDIASGVAENIRRLMECETLLNQAP